MVENTIRDIGDLETLVIVVTDCIDVAAIEIKYSLISAFKDNGISCKVEFVFTEKYSIDNAAFLIRQLAETVPSGAVFYPVINAESSEQARILGRTKRKNFFYIGRDSGALDWLISDFGCIEQREVHELPYVPFGGRSVYPKILADYMSDNIEKYATSIVEPQAIFTCEKGKVLHIDNFGNCKINLYIDEGLHNGQEIFLIVNNKKHLVAEFYVRMMSAKKYTLVLYKGSSLSGLIELGIVMGHAAKEYDLRVGDIIEFMK